MDIIITEGTPVNYAEIDLPLSKTIASRLLTICFLENIHRFPTGNISEDIEVFVNAVKVRSKSERVIKLNQSGTAYRFLLAAASFTKGTTIFTGKPSLFRRPITPLIEALKSVGADIELYTDRIIVRGKELTPKNITINAEKSGQFLSALLLLGNKLPHGATITAAGKIASYSFVKTTINLLQHLGIYWEQKGNIFLLKNKDFNPNFSYEKDWSSSSYFMLLSLIRKDLRIFFPGLNINSIQPDAKIKYFLEQLGLVFTVKDEGVEVSPEVVNFSPFNFDMEEIPDMILGFAMFSLYTGRICEIAGTRTLPYKETDRLKALKQELEKTGAKVFVSENKITIDSRNLLRKPVIFDTYEDHRMAMSESLLVGLFPEITIKDAEVVGKTFPNYWEELKKTGVGVLYTT